MGLDIDVGMPVAEVEAKVAALGCVAVVYTTHSHLKTSTEFAKSRIVKFADGAEIENDEVAQGFLRQSGLLPYIADGAEYVGTEHTDNGVMVEPHLYHLVPPRDVPRLHRPRHAGQDDQGRLVPPSRA